MKWVPLRQSTGERKIPPQLAEELAKYDQELLAEYNRRTTVGPNGMFRTRSKDHLPECDSGVCKNSP